MGLGPVVLGERGTGQMAHQGGALEKVGSEDSHGTEFRSCLLEVVDPHAKSNKYKLLLAPN